MAKFTKNELEALGRKLDAAQLSQREREILSHIIDAATGGEAGGFGDELSEAELAGVAGGAGTTSTSFSDKLKGVTITKPWSPGTIKAPQSQYSDSPWNNSAVVKM